MVVLLPPRTIGRGGDTSMQSHFIKKLSTLILLLRKEKLI
jgi:hypothetical protein